MRAIRGLFHIGLAVAGLIGLVGAASAQVISDDVGLNDSFEQTSDSVATESGAFFSARVDFTNTDDYSGGTVTVPSTTVETLSSAGASLQFEDQAPTLAMLQMTYGTGTYTFALTGNTQPNISIDQSYVGDTYPNIALVTNYMALQGVNANSVTLDLNGMVPHSGANQYNIFLYVYNATTNALVYASGALSYMTTAIDIGDLAPGTNYYYNLEYDDRIFDTTDDGTIAQYQIYDNDTNGNFSTAGAVPEPSTWAMMLIGFAGLGYAGYRSKRKRGPAFAA